MTLVKIFSKNLPIKFWNKAHRIFRRLVLRDLIDEVDMLFKTFVRVSTPGVMYDVGAHYGYSLQNFSRSGWHVEAFEPDRKNYRELIKQTAGFDKVNLHACAVGAEDIESVDFYTSPESTGVSGLSPFLSSHEKDRSVRLTTLASFIRKTGAPYPDFLKIDTEGHDLFVLQGYPWQQHKPRFVLCEFENNKSRPLGYDFLELCAYLTDRGYSLIISEWHPIQRYGVLHRWKRFHSSGLTQLNENAWGNIFAFQDNDDYQLAKRSWRS